MSDHYTYLWHDRERPLYVGRGRGARAAAHLIDKPWAKGRDLRCEVFAATSLEEANLMESFLVLSLRSFQLQNRALPRSFNPYREEPLPSAIGSALRTALGLFGPPPEFAPLLRLANLLREVQAIRDRAVDPFETLYCELIDLRNARGEERTRQAAWLLREAWEDFEDAELAALEFLTYDHVEVGYVAG